MTDLPPRPCSRRPRGGGGDAARRRGHGPGGLGAGVRPGAALAGADRGGDDIGDGEHHHRQRRRALRAGLRQLRGQRQHRGGDADAPHRRLRDPVHHGFRLKPDREVVREDSLGFQPQVGCANNHPVPP